MKCKHWRRMDNRKHWLGLSRDDLPEGLKHGVDQSVRASPVSKMTCLPSMNSSESSSLSIENV